MAKPTSPKMFDPAQLAIEPSNIRAKEAILQVFKINSEDPKEAKPFGYIDFYRNLASSKPESFALQILLASNILLIVCESVVVITK